MNVSNKSKRKTNKETERERDLYDPTVKTTDFGLSGAMMRARESNSPAHTRTREDETQSRKIYARKHYSIAQIFTLLSSLTFARES